METYDTAALVRVILAWMGAGAGVLMGLGCLGGAMTAWIEGRSRPFAKGQSEWWLCMGMAAGAVLVSAGCLWYIFLADRAPVSRSPSMSPTISQPVQQAP